MKVVGPVCGTEVEPARAVSLRVDLEVFNFCSEFCRVEYLRRHPRAERHEARANRHIAWFSMELAADPRMPTYAGGLGVLAGDMLRAAADLQVPMVGITLLHRLGYFHQRLDEAGNQRDELAPWDPTRHIQQLETIIAVPLALPK